MTNVYLRWLGVLAATLPSVALLFAIIGALTQQQGELVGELGAGAVQFAIAGWLLQWGVLAFLLWLLGRGIVAPSEQSRVAATEVEGVVG